MEKPKLTFTYSINLFAYGFVYAVADEPTHSLNVLTLEEVFLLLFPVLVLLLSDSIYWCSLWFTFCRIQLAIVAVLCTLYTLFLTISNGQEGFPVRRYFFLLAMVFVDVLIPCVVRRA